MARKSKNYFIALTGEKKNVGDFLITNRAISLLEHIAPEYEFIVQPHWKELDNIEFVNNSEGIIILGGPGFQMKMYPDVYKLKNNLKDIKVPVYTLGSGWKGKPGDEITEHLYCFSKSSHDLLDKMEATFSGMSCRDYQTERVLKNNGYRNVTMTGCPVWYDINSINKKFIAPEKIKRIVFTPAQDLIYSNQSIEVMKYLRNKYNKAELIVSFHRGIGKVDQYTPESDARNTQKLAEFASSIGVEVIDVSYNASKINFYDECDLHVGYRVHAHIYFLSKRFPSVLLHEDGRGNGVSEALKSPGINAYIVSLGYSSIFNMFRLNSCLASIYGRLGLKVNESLTFDLDKMITELEKTNFDCFKNTSSIIDKHYKVMEQFIRKMTYGREVE